MKSLSLFCTDSVLYLGKGENIRKRRVVGQEKRQSKEKEADLVIEFLRKEGNDIKNNELNRREIETMRGKTDVGQKR